MTAGPVLRDIHLPAAPSWWPPAPGWWALAALVAIALAWLLRRHLHARRMQRARRALQREFDRLRADAPDGASQVAAMSLLLRRAAKRYAPAALALRDGDWLRFLDADDASQPFSRGAGRVLADGPYRPRVAQEDADALAPIVRKRLDLFVTHSVPASRPGKPRPPRAAGIPRARHDVHG
jgi:hypothetical protein